MNRPIIQKHEYMRSKKWTDWVKEQPSCVSGLPADDPHHIKGYSWLTGSGGSIKGDDLFVIPLTRREHAHFDYMGWKTWEKVNGSQLEHWARLMAQAIRDGIVRMT